MKGLVTVMFKEDVADVAGRAVQERLAALGFSEVKDVRIGKVIELVIESADRENTEDRIAQMCSRLLVNPAIEESTIQVIG